MNNMKLRVCLTDKCNFLCEYCREGGEAGFNSENQMDSDKLVVLLEELNKCGFEALRFTGGEPLLRKDWYEIVKKVSDKKIFKKITMVTNGSMILRNDNARKIADAGFKSVTVSLDSIDKCIFSDITHYSCYEDVIKGILKLKEYGVNVKINSVISKRNIDKVFELIDFCADNKMNIKLLDLVGMDSDYWKKEYVSFDGIEDKLRKNADEIFTQYQDEGFGTPEHVYNYKGIEVVVKNSNQGTCYIESCKKCKKFPCQSGIVSMILSHDGLLKVCSLNDSDYVDVKPLVENDLTIKKQIGEIINAYNSAQFYDGEWNSKCS